MLKNIEKGLCFGGGRCALHCLWERASRNTDIVDKKPSHKPVWVEAVPKGCRVGVSGPTMVAAHALRLARRRAIAPFARDRAAVRLKSASVFIENRTQSHYREVTTQASRTHVSGGFVVAIYRDLGSDRVFALVCDQAQARPPSMPVFEGRRGRRGTVSPMCAGVSLRRRASKSSGHRPGGCETAAGHHLGGASG